MPGKEYMVKHLVSGVQLNMYMYLPTGFRTVCVHVCVCVGAWMCVWVWMCVSIVMSVGVFVHVRVCVHVCATHAVCVRGEPGVYHTPQE